MNVNEDLILKLEKLAKLKLEPDERTMLTNDLSKILAMIDDLLALDTDGVEPLIYLTENATYAAADIKTTGLGNTAVFQNAPKHDGKYFKVPKINEESGNKKKE
jgi:aspartyl-tRNA(Asn)/glutamyl-tRNA(Gln) amidotransferase subunit C